MSAHLHRQESVGLALALQLVQVAIDHAEMSGARVTVVVSDAAGDVVASARMDGAAPISPAAARAKAWTSAALGLTTEAWGTYSVLDRPLAMPSLLDSRLTSMKGGVPLSFDGVTVGAVGVSGSTEELDTACADAAADRFAELVGAP